MKNFYDWIKEFVRDQGEFIAQQSGWLELERSSYAKLIAQTISHVLNGGSLLVSADSSTQMDSIDYDENIAKVSIVGVGMKSHSGVASIAFKALAKDNINIMMISTSEIKISVLIDIKYAELAVRTLHAVYQLDR
ncbi:ACT domain-containing protein [Helicobacter pylori]|nr:ACT domain-containing protein [Helicobacter pylori]